MHKLNALWPMVADEVHNYADVYGGFLGRLLFTIHDKSKAGHGTEPAVYPVLLCAELCHLYGRIATHTHYPVHVAA